MRDLFMSYLDFKLSVDGISTYTERDYRHLFRLCLANVETLDRRSLPEVRQALSNGVKPITERGRLRYLRAFIKWLEDCGHIDEGLLKSPYLRLPKVKKQSRSSIVQRDDLGCS